MPPSSIRHCPPLPPAHLLRHPRVLRTICPPTHLSSHIVCGWQRRPPAFHYPRRQATQEGGELEVPGGSCHAGSERPKRDGKRGGWSYLNQREGGRISSLRGLQHTAVVRSTARMDNSILMWGGEGKRKGGRCLVLRGRGCLPGSGGCPPGSLASACLQFAPCEHLVSHVLQVPAGCADGAR